MDEPALIRRAQAGDPHRPSVTCWICTTTPFFRFAWKWCRHRANAEDIAQQACIKLAGSLGAISFPGSVYQLVVPAGDQLRAGTGNAARAAMSTMTLADAESPQVQPHAEDQSLPGAGPLRTPRNLGEGMKETALLVHGEGMSHAEAGMILGVSESTISWRLHVIRRHMGKREDRISESV